MMRKSYSKPARDCTSSDGAEQLSGEIQVDELDRLVLEPFIAYRSQRPNSNDELQIALGGSR